MAYAAEKLEADFHASTRRTPRASVYVSMDVFSEHNFWTGLTMNMSEGGVFVATHHEVPVGTVLVTHMSLPFEEEPVVILAEVRWRRPLSDDPDSPPGLGLQFVDASDDAVSKIRRFVSTVRDPLFFEE